MVNIKSEAEKLAIANKFLVTSERLFAKYGYLGVSLSEVAKESGVSKGTLFNYFTNKETLFMCLLLRGYQQYFEILFEKLSSLPNLSDAELLDFFEKETRYLIQNKITLLRLNALRAPILERKADKNQTIEGRKVLNNKIKLVGELLAQKVSGMSADSIAHLFLAQAAILSGLLNMSELESFNQESIELTFDTFQLNMVADGIEMVRAYVTHELQKRGKINAG
ncbi:TetR/AcrR family transcriptional regulator [Streptococcus equinus]|uniref:TetR/AcrR family transcriptional regulator n=1 Tax=Streptococcus equinus TaxID=1335 RepID=UPI0008E5F83C|nr:TetR/AcrR family transcriptional regulator [Streptococcus equinus]SFQ62311.1 transcriptional regulator, TetR family [Streptococcus equinus]